MSGRSKDTPRPPTRLGLRHVDPSLGCFNGCGETEPNLLRTYALVLDGKPTGFVWRLCANCLVWGNPRNPRDTDPLDVTAG